MSGKFRWGILGTGSIAAKFAEGLRDAAGAKLIAVGSRRQATADAFADRFDVPRRHGSYAELAGDPDVDVIYVATPHPFHKENSILCLKGGKAVLCEKPFTINAAQAQEVIDLARRKKLFCMEAMWTRFLPSLAKVRQLLADGAIGQVRMLTADFGYRCAWNVESRNLNPALGGGGLLDVGVYPLSLASMVFGEPESIAGQAHIGATGVDEQAAVVLSYDDGRLAAITCGVRTETPQEAWILGTEGAIHLHGPWWRGSPVTLAVGGKDAQHFDVPVRGNGYNYEAEEVGRCVASGTIESDIMPLDETLELMKTMDAIRAQWGLKYPMEQ